MFTILLVDDDAVFRTQMKSRINWEEEGFVIVSEAHNGKEAIEMIETCKPDIIITDISMPVINGIELIDYVSEFHKEIQIIALSAYNDFDYVRDSLKGGALDYLLKNELSNEYLLKILRAAASRLAEKNVQGSIRPVLNREKSIQEFLILLISGCINSREEILASLRELGLEMLAKGLIVAVMEPDNERLKKDLDESEYYKFLYSTKSIMQESVNSSRGALVTVIGRNRILVLIPILGRSMRAFQDHYRKVLANMRDNVSRFLNEKVSFGVSKLCTDITRLSPYYEQAVEILESKRFQGKTSFIAEADSELKDNGIITLDVGVEREIYASIRGKSDTAASTIVRRIFDGFLKEGRSKEDIQIVLAELLNIVMREIQDNNISKEQIFQEDNLSYQTLHKYRNLPELKEWFTGVFDRLDQFCAKSRLTAKYNEITRKSIRYMEKNYRSRISLRNIAKEVSVNSSYLSRLFKNDTGINIMDYLNKIRIEKSAALIREGKLSLKSIADEVGIPSYNHFFKLFKKYYGVTPGEYKQKTESNGSDT